MSDSMSGGEIQEYNSSFFNVVVKGYIEVFGLTLIWLENKCVGVGWGSWIILATPGLCK